MNERELSELEDAENWDFGKAEKRLPVKPNRVVVSVSLTRDEFERISKFAEQIGVSTSVFIKRAALEASTHQGKSFVLLTGGGLGGSILASTPSWTTYTTGTEALTSAEPKKAATY